MGVQGPTFTTVTFLPRTFTLQREQMTVLLTVSIVLQSTYVINLDRRVSRRNTRDIDRQQEKRYILKVHLPRL